MSEIFLSILAFLCGASIASFLAVFRRRVPFGRSHCDSCRKKLGTLELVPVFSYVFLRGRCVACKESIGIQYFLSEVLLGTWFFAVFKITYSLGAFNSWDFIFYIIFGSIFFYLSLQDFEEKEVSSKLLYSLVAISILYQLSKISLGFNFLDIYISLFIFFLFWTINRLNASLLGEGDSYLFLSIGFIFGGQFLLSTFLYSIWLGTFISLAYIYWKFKKFVRGFQVPFYPIIFLGALLVLLTNFHIISLEDLKLIYEIFMYTGA